MILVFFVDEYSAFEYLLRDTVSVKLSYSNNRIPGEDSSYVFMVSSKDVFSMLIQNINLPANKPDLSNMKSYYLEN